MKVLVACEFSGRVRDAFIRKGHDAISCDLLPTEVPGPHIQGDVLLHLEDGWDMLIAFPPCTYLCRQANRWITSEKESCFEKACLFFQQIKQTNCSKICVENPVPHARAKKAIGDYSQIIQPWQFGHDYSKKTCLWLKGLSPLRATEVVPVTYIVTPNGRKYTKEWYYTPRNSTARSRTFQGIANAMAEQWG